MSEFPHFRLEGREKSEEYTWAGGGGGGKFKRPTRNQRAHAKTVRAGLEGIGAEVERRRESDISSCPDLVEYCADGVILTFHSDAEHELNLGRLDRGSEHIRLVGVNEVDGVQIARVFVPADRISAFLKLVDEYAASVSLTYLGDPKDEGKLVALQEPSNGMKFCKPVRKKKIDGVDKITVKFTIAGAKVAAFKKKVGDQAELFAESRAHEELIDSIASVRLAIIQDFWQDKDPFPAKGEKIWWEVWLIGSRATAEADYRQFVDIARTLGISRVSDVYVAFPERVVVHALASANQLSAVDVLALIGELRRGKELATDYADMPAREQRDFIQSLLENLTAADAGDAPCVCILDAGVNRPHPLLVHSLAEEDQHAAIAEWGVFDHHRQQHGTGMAGIALYGCLTQALTATGSVKLRHILESAKIMPPTGKNDPPDYGRRMQDGVALAHIQAPKRNRVLCMAVTADDYKSGGVPSLWSGAVDDMCFGGEGGNAKRLMFVSAGNMRAEILEKDYEYHTWNTERGGIENPGQAWNALTVGAFTERVELRAKSLKGYTPIAQSGELCPTSRTSLAWPANMRDDWPIKPDIVLEGGNYARKGEAPMSCDDLSLLTTIMRPDKLLTTMLDTSPATALAARMAAILWSHHPKLRPETVRALLVHSAKWTPAMLCRFPGDTKSVALQCLRCYGYGVPDLQRALHSAKDAVTMIYEGGLTPYRLEKSEVRTNHMNVHALPWPTEALKDLGEEKVTMRVTLSYFVEPSPGSVCWKVNHRYASYGLRFDVIRPTESPDGFKRRISRDFWAGPKKRPTNEKETRVWTIGEDNRTLGSLHSDWWTGTAATLARSGSIVVYPVSGWWRERKHLKKYDDFARYSLIVSIKSRKRGLNLYSLVENVGAVKTEVMV
jgi:Subtilase family